MHYRPSGPTSDPEVISPTSPWRRPCSEALVAEAAGWICQPLKPIQTARAEQGWSAKPAASLMPAQRRAGVCAAADDTGAKAAAPGGGVAGCRGFCRVLGLQTRKQWVSTRAPRTEDQAQMVFRAIGRIGR